MLAFKRDACTRIISAQGDSSENILAKRLLVVAHWLDQVHKVDDHVRDTIVYVSLALSLSTKQLTSKAPGVKPGVKHDKERSKPPYLTMPWLRMVPI